MRICLVSEEYPTSSSGRGGIGTYTFALAQGLSQSGEEVFVISRSEVKEEECQDGSVLVYRIPPLCFSVPFLHTSLNIFGYSLALHRKLKKVIREKGIEIVEAPEYGAEAFFFSRTKKRIPLVVRLHTPHIVTEEVTGIKPDSYSHIVRWMEKETVIHADFITSPSRSLAELCQDKMKVRKSFSVIPNPIDTSRFISKGYRDRLSTQVILQVGKFQDLKNTKVLIQALPEVLKIFPQIKLRLIGSDTLTGPRSSSYRQMVEGLAHELGVRDRVEFSDMIPRKELIEHYQQARLAVVPSLFENFPFTCLEAMSCGCPVIASNVGGLPEMIEDGVSGFLFQPDNKEELAEKIVALLSDPALAESMGNEAAIRVRRCYSQEVIIPQILNVYRQLTDKNRGNG
ncbi:MAG: glycosyltransferase family 4 protein [Proteobacteria bacterium]|nr:glycosyltransferase family 4 protein [Pseudomonadota bacterium]